MKLFLLRVLNLVDIVHYNIINRTIHQEVFLIQAILKRKRNRPSQFPGIGKIELTKYLTKLEETINYVWEKN